MKTTSLFTNGVADSGGVFPSLPAFLIFISILLLLLLPPVVFGQTGEPVSGLSPVHGDGAGKAHAVTGDRAGDVLSVSAALAGKPGTAASTPTSTGPGAADGDGSASRGLGAYLHPVSALGCIVLLFALGGMRLRGHQRSMDRKRAQLEAELLERRRVEEELRESEERFRRLSEASFEGILIHDNGVLLTANRQWLDMVGYDLSELAGKQILETVVAPESVETVRSRIAGNFREIYEITGIRKDGSRFPMQVRAHPAEYRGRQARVVTALDLTEHRKNREINRTLFQISSAINITADLDELYRSIREALGRVVDVTNFLIGLYNPVDETVSFPCFVSEVGESFPGVYPCDRSNSLSGEVIETGRPLFLKEEALLARQGSSTRGVMGRIPKVWLGVPLKLGEEAIGIMGVQSYTDGDLYDDRDVDILLSVSEQVALAIRHKRVNDQLREREHNLSMIFESIPDAVTISDRSTGAYVHVNDGFTRITGYDAEEVLGKRPGELALFTSPTDGAASVMGEGEVDNLEISCGNRRGDTVHMLLSTRHIQYGGEDCVITVGKEITGVKRTEEEKAKLELQLQHAQKMEAIGTLAGGIAHDFNNLMMAIQGNVSLLGMDLGEEHPGRKKLGNIADAVERGSSLTRQLLGFSRGTKVEVRSSNLNRIMGKNAQMFGRTSKGLTIREDYAPDLWPVQVDGGQIDQVLLNLFVNASHAMEGGGKLDLSTENTELSPGFVKTLGVRPGKYVKMSVADTGIGMDPAVKSRIFEPFFTTREKGRGTGLGLATTYTIIKKHKGFVQVYSEPGNGTRFDIYFPCSEIPAVEEVKPADTLVGGSETILLVDDEHLIREISTEILKELGYKVVAAESGAAALGIFKERKGEFHMVILDIVMPDMGGGEVFEALRKIDKGIKVLLSSGYSLNSRSRVLLERGCNGFIQKPFNINRLAGRIREILDA